MLSTGWIIFFVLVITWTIIMVYAKKNKTFLEKYNLSTYAIWIMWRTEKGKKMIEKIAAFKTFWKGFGYFSIAFTFIAMAAMMGLLIWIATIVPFIPAENAPSFRLILGIPGINPVIPLWQGTSSR